jgi:hypothetical protein
LLKLVAVKTTDPLQLAIASEASQLVTGSLATTELYKPDVHIFFLAFRTEKDASAFQTAFRTTYADTSLFKVAAVTDSSGKFSAWLPAGYVYLALWEAPAQHGDDRYFNWSGHYFEVDPYTPATLAYPIVA